MANAVRVLLLGFIFKSYISISIAMQMPGGISSVDVPSDRDEIMKGLDIFLKNKTIDDFGSSGVVYGEICGTLQASQQVVEGILYRVGVKMVLVRKSDFQKNYVCVEDLDSESLKVVDRGVKFGCFTVWSRPWMGKLEVAEKKDSSDYKSCLEVNS